MDRDEALRLLRGGPEGVAEWNQLRSTKEDIPSLAGADFRKRDLRGANLRQVDLGHADLYNANLMDADLSGSPPSTNLQLDPARLGHAIIPESDGANLRNDFTGG